MRLRLITIALLVLGFVLSGTSLTAQAQWWRWGRPRAPQVKTYYVRTDGNNGNNGLANTSGGAWRTIDWAADHVVAGDITRVQAGTYIEAVTPGVSGTSGRTITLVADGTVTFCGIGFTGQSYIRVIGFTMDGSVGGCTLAGYRLTISGTNTGLEFWNNTFDNSNHSFYVGASDRCNSCIIMGGSIHHVNNGFHGITITGNDSFVGYVDFDQICYLGVSPSGNRLRFVNLNFNHMIQCNGTHPDFIYPQGLNTFGYSNNLMESSYGIGNVASIDNKAMHVQTQSATAWADNLWRLNVTYNLGSGFFSVYDTLAAITRFRFYHNTIVNCVRASSGTQYNNCGNFSAQAGNGVSASIYDNIFYQAWSDEATTGAYVAGWAETGGPVITKDYNLAYASNGPVTNFLGIWTGQAHPQSNVNPSFVNTTSDFTLQAGSGARGVGGPLTTASGSGSSSTTLTVASNTGSLFIGNNASNLPQYGGALVPGDVITVGSTAVRVSSVSGDTLTLASPISWNNGASVYFGSSSTIDIGAYPYKSGGYSLTATYTRDGSSVSVTPSDPSLVRFVVCYIDGIPIAVDHASPYTCSVGSGTLEVRVYPFFASTTLSVLATPE